MQIINFINTSIYYVIQTEFRNEIALIDLFSFPFLADSRYVSKVTYLLSSIENSTFLGKGAKNFPPNFLYSFNLNAMIFVHQPSCFQTFCFFESILKV